MPVVAEIVGDLVTLPVDFKPVDAGQCGVVASGVESHAVNNDRRKHMKAMVDLFSTDYGLFSVGVLAFIIVMAVWFYRFFNRKMLESEAQQRR